MGRPWQLVGQLEKSFQVANVPTNVDEIPKKVDVLFIFHPAVLSEKTAYAIDQFLMRGGRALIFVDPLAEIAQRMPGAGGKFLQPSGFDAGHIRHEPAEEDKARLRRSFGCVLGAIQAVVGDGPSPRPW